MNRIEYKWFSLSAVGCLLWVLCFGALALGEPHASVEFPSENCKKAYRQLATEIELARRSLALRASGKFPRPISTSESHIITDLHDRILPWYSNPENHGYFVGKNGLKIFYRKFVQSPGKEKGAIVISHGFAESSSKWAETAFNLWENGYSVYIVDHRGHGKSDSPAKFPHQVHVEKFSHYVGDLKTFQEQVVDKDNFEGRKKHLIGYSMGGAVATRYLKKFPGDFDRAVLVAPMLMIHMSFVPEWLAYPVVKLGGLLHGKDKYAWMMSNHHIDPPFMRQDMTHSRSRFMVKQMRYRLEGEDKRGGPSFHWTVEAMFGARKARQAAPDIDTPMLVIQGGRDKVVSKWAMDRFCNGAPNCSKLSLPEAGHDVMWETDPVRDELFRTVFYFLEKP